MSKGQRQTQETDNMTTDITGVPKEVDELSYVEIIKDGEKQE